MFSNFIFPWSVPSICRYCLFFSDRGEVKVLSDLAMISAGDTPMELDKVACFNSAVMGFAPFLFDLKKTSGLDDVLRALKSVQEHRDRDPELPEKWVGDFAFCLPGIEGLQDDSKPNYRDSDMWLAERFEVVNYGKVLQNYRYGFQFSIQPFLSKFNFSMSFEKEAIVLLTKHLRKGKCAAETQILRCRYFVTFG